jgi:hypothetical protein
MLPLIEVENMSFQALLSKCIVEAQTQLATAIEKERFASEKQMESSMRLSSLESQISSLRQERSRLLAELDVERAKVELAEEAKHKYEYFIFMANKCVL